MPSLNVITPKIHPQGLCTYGTKCMFAHGTNELRSANGGGGTPKVARISALSALKKRKENRRKRREG